MLLTKRVSKGRLHGVAKSYHSNGVVKREEPYHKGQLNGDLVERFRNGSLKMQLSYSNGSLHGRRREWFATGRMKLECFYVDNKIQGPCFEWFINGLIKEQGMYWLGKRHGVWKEYSRDGKLIDKQIYIRGVRLNNQIQRLLAKNRLRAKHIVKIRNTAVRRICIEEIGYETFLKDCEYQLIDKDDDQELIRIDYRKDEEPLFLVKVQCSTTGAFYTLRVPPTMKKAKEAIAWTFGLSEDKYNPTSET